MVCALCQKTWLRLGQLLCAWCETKIFPTLTRPLIRTLYYPGSYVEVLSLGPYEGAFKKLIHRAKIAGDFRAILLLNKCLYAHASLIKDFVPHPELIYPLASSLWGRLRGRPDLAYQLARGLNQHLFHTQLSNGPARLYWRPKKRAHDQGRRNKAKDIRFGPMDLFWARESEKIEVLLVDDLVTTGLSINELLVCLPPKRTRVLTLAFTRGLKNDTYDEAVLRT